MSSSCAIFNILDNIGANLKFPHITLLVAFVFTCRLVAFSQDCDEWEGSLFYNTILSFLFFMFCVQIVLHRLPNVHMKICIISIFYIILDLNNYVVF